MKHLLLIAPAKAEETTASLVLSEAEKEALPFSLLSFSSDGESPKAPLNEQSFSDGDNDSYINSEEAPPFDENPPIPSILLLSDCDAVLENAKSRGIPSLRLPKRQFPLADTLQALALDAYDTVILHLRDAVDVDPLTVISAEKSLVLSTYAEGAACTYRTVPELKTEGITDLSSLTAAFFSEEAPIDPKPVARIEEKKTPTAHAIFEWLELFTLSLAAVLLIMTFFIRHSPVVGSSMTPTLHESDVLLLTEIGFTPETGDIVIIQTDKDDLRRPLVKRVIATGGDTVRIDFETWQIYLNGILLDEPYLDSTDKSEVMHLYSIAQHFEKVDELHAVYEATVPEGHIFALGDNRQNSKDSRDLGFIDERHVIGEVIFRLLPFSAMGDPT